MNHNIRFFTLLVLAIGFVCARGSAQGEPAKKKAITIESMAEVHDLKLLEHRMKKTSLEQASVIRQVTGKVDRFVKQLEDIKSDLAHARQAWIRDPSNLTEALVSRAVTRGAANGREAALNLSTLEEDAKHVIAKLRKGLGKVREDVKRITDDAVRKKLQFQEKLHDAERLASEASEIVVAAGVESDAELSPEMEEKLHRLRFDIQALEVSVDVWESLGAWMAENSDILSEVESDYDGIIRLCRKLGHAGRRTAGVFGQIGLAEAKKIRIKTMTAAYEDVARIRTQMRQSLSKLKNLGQGMGDMVDATQGLPRNGRSVKKGGKTRTGSGLVSFFRRYGKDDSKSK